MRNWDWYLTISPRQPESRHPLPTAPIVPCFVSAGDPTCVFTLDWGCRRTLVTIIRGSSTSTRHTDAFTLDEGCLPRVRHPVPMSFLNHLDYALRFYCHSNSELVYSPPQSASVSISKDPAAFSLYGSWIAEMRIGR